jgi:hypothetical protein
MRAHSTERPLRQAQGRLFDKLRAGSSTSSGQALRQAPTARRAGSRGWFAKFMSAKSAISAISPLLMCRLAKFKCAISAISPLRDGERGVPQGLKAGGSRGWMSGLKLAAARKPGPTQGRSSHIRTCAPLWCGVSRVVKTAQSRERTERTLLQHFRNYCGAIKVARCGFPWEKTTKRPVASRISCSAALAENSDVRLSSWKVACSWVVPITSTGKIRVRFAPIAKLLHVDFCPSQAPSWGAGMLRTSMICHCHITVCYIRVIMRTSADPFPVVGGGCTGRARRCKAKQGSREDGADVWILTYAVVRPLGRVKSGRRCFW